MAPADPDRDVRELVRAQELADLRAALEDARRRERRHWTVAVFGVSPSVIVVALGLLASGSVGLLVLFSVIVALVEGWRASRAGREAHALEMRLREREGGGPGAAGREPGGGGAEA